MTTVQTIYDDIKKRRVLIIRRDDGSFGFEEERFSDEPLEMCWISFGRYSVCHCDTAERAVIEARGRVSWLSESKHETVAKPCAAANPAGASRLQLLRPVRRVAEPG